MGDQCDRCLNGYFGDAVIVKNCARCACSECGTVTAVCNHTTGLCKCKPNVTGVSCDSCKVSRINFIPPQISDLILDKAARTEQKQYSQK